MEPACEQLSDGLMVAGPIRREGDKLYVGRWDLVNLIEVRQWDLVVEGPGGAEVTPRSCRVWVEYEH